MSEFEGVREVIKAVGLHELDGISDSEIEDRFLLAALTGLFDNDLLLGHLDYARFEGEDAVMYGETYYNDGRVAKAIAQAAILNSGTPGLLYEFQDYMTDLVDEELDELVPMQPSTAFRVFPEVIMVDENPIALARPPEVVVNLGSCTSTRSLITDQVNFVNCDVRPFTFAPVSRMHFTHQILGRTYRRHYGDQIAQMVEETQLFRGREDGDAAATEHFLTSQQEHGKPTDLVDIITFGESQHTTAWELEQAIKRTHQLLKVGGMLVARCFTKPVSGDIGIDDVTRWAFESGFKERDMLVYESTRAVFSQLSLGEQDAREMRTLVLQKN